jgi:hypothetical protein
VRFVSTEQWRRKLAPRSTVIAKLQAQPKIFIFDSADGWRP